MRVLMLAEGDAERWDSWSGSTKSVVDHLRAVGHDVVTADMDLYGSARWLAAARTFSPNRKRWGVKYHLMAPGYAGRSRLATRALGAYPGRPDCVIQIGATFEAAARGGVPYAVFSDSNIQTSLEGAKYGVSDAVWLTPAELEAVHRREQRVYRDACVVLTISDFLRRSFIEHFGVAEDRVHTVGAGPNLDLARVPAPPAAPRTDAPTVLFVGKQFERKGGAVLLEAFRIVRGRFPDARLIIIGPPKPPTPEPGVEWLGHLDKNDPGDWARLVAAYRGSDVFCLPSLFEPFGIVILEAMFFGLPCVGTDRWAIPEMIAEGETGHTVPRDDSTVLADRLTGLLADRPRAHRMGLAGRRRAEEGFTWTVVVDRIADRLERCRRPAQG